MKSTLKKWFTDPEYSVRVHATFGLAWLSVGTPVTVLWLADSVAFVAWMSLYALVLAHWTGWQAAHAEKRVKRMQDDPD